MTKRNALILMSGGIDSSTLLAYIIDKGFTPYILSFDYSQRNKVEIEKVKEFVKDYDIKMHKILKANFGDIGGSALTDNIEVPKDAFDASSPEDEIPVTYVPARNTIFLSYAVAVAETLKIQDIFFGAHIYDYSNYPDCRPEYIEAFEKMANLGTEMGVTGKKISINAPFVKMSKADIVKIGLGLNVDYSKTLSCYDPSEGVSCGHCDACIIRKKAFEENGVQDPIKYL